MALPVPQPPSQALSLGELRGWTVKLTSYLQSVEQANAYGQRLVVLPGWTDVAKATGNGIIMFDPVLGLPVFSYDGSWHPLVTREVVQEMIDDTYIFGGFRLSAPVAGADITNAWQRLTAADALSPPAKNMEVDLVDHRFRFSREGVYTLTANLAFLHNNNGAERVMLIRLRAEDNSFIGLPTYIPTAGSTRATQNSITAYLTVTPAILGTWFIVEISVAAGDPDYTSVEWAIQALYFSLLGTL